MTPVLQVSARRLRAAMWTTFRRISGEVLWQEPALDAAEMLRLADLGDDEEDTVAWQASAKAHP